MIETDTLLENKEAFEISEISTGFENTHFKSCNFLETDLSDFEFIDCIFENCNLSLVKLGNTGLKNIHFINCKLTGIDFSVSQRFLFQVNFTNSILDLTNFTGKKMIKTRFENCDLKDAYFAETNLDESAFNNCNLEGAIFDRCSLKKADLRTAENYVINPLENKLKHAKFSITGLPGLVTQFDIKIY